MYAAVNASVKRYQIKKKPIKTASKIFIQSLCECFLNVVNGNVAINKTTNWNSQKILSKQTGLKKKRRILGTESELLKTVGLSCYFYLMVS